MHQVLADPSERRLDVQGVLESVLLAMLYVVDKDISLCQQSVPLFVQDFRRPQTSQKCT